MQTPEQWVEMVDRQIRYARAIETAAAQLGCDPDALAEWIRGGGIGRLIRDAKENIDQLESAGYDARLGAWVEADALPPAKETT